MFVNFSIKYRLEVWECSILLKFKLLCINNMIAPCPSASTSHKPSISQIALKFIVLALCSSIWSFNWFMIPMDESHHRFEAISLSVMSMFSSFWYYNYCWHLPILSGWDYSLVKLRILVNIYNCNPEIFLEVQLTWNCSANHVQPEQGLSMQL